MSDILANQIAVQAELLSIIVLLVCIIVRLR